LGNVRGRTEYYWTGTPHASTSVRVDWTNSGGTMLDLSTYCRIIAVLGLGMAQITPIYAPMVNGGSIYQWSRAGNRDINLVLDFSGANPGDVAQKISAVQKAFDATSNKYGQPTRLMLVGYDAAGTTEQSETVFVDVAYRGGLEGGFTSYKHERKNVQLQNYDPALRAEGYEQVALTYQAALTGNCVVRQTPDGTFDNYGITTTTSYYGGYVMAKNPATGITYLGGKFISLNGDVNAKYIAQRSPAGVWSALDGTALNDEVRDIVIGTDGYVYFAGSFGNAGGIATADYIARWDGATTSSITTTAAANQPINALAFSRVGHLYAGGEFTDINSSGADYLARWDGTNWNTVVSATGLNGFVYDIIPDPWGDGVIVAGAFTDAGGTAANDYLVRITVSGSTYAYARIGGTPNGIVHKLHYDSQFGRLYAMGDFTAIGSVSFAGIAYYDGSSWRALGSGIVPDLTTNIYGGMATDTDGNLLVAGYKMASAGGITLSDGFAMWSGNQWQAAKFDPTGDYGFNVWIDPDTGDWLWMGNITSAVVEGVTSVTNAGYADTYPTLIITGPGTVYGVQNYMTGERVDFNGLTLRAGEYATVVFGPDGILSAEACAGAPFSSRNGNLSICRNLIPYIVPGSSPTLHLAPGTNSIGLYVYGGTTAATAASLSWPATYRAIEGAVR